MTNVPSDADAPPPVERIIEAILFVESEPFTAQQACEVIRGLTREQFSEILAELNRCYRTQGRPYRIQTRGEGYQMMLLPRFRQVLDRLYGSTRQTHLSQSARDVLALVAYRQPITRQEVESLRGADSGAVLRQLVRLGLIAISHDEGEEREVRYTTTRQFLQMAKLRNLEDLPRAQEMQ